VKYGVRVQCKNTLPWAPAPPKWKQNLIEALLFFGWWLATTLIIIALLSGCSPRVSIPPNEQVVRIGTAIHQQCQEDMPCWNCHTMGNHICGPKGGK